MTHPIHLRAAAISAALTLLVLANPATAATPTAPAKTDELKAIQHRGDANVDARVKSLGDLSAKVSSALKLTADQKATLTSDIQGQVTALTTLKTKLDADTDLATAKIDFQAIFKDHFIYAFYVPRMNRLAAADRLLDTATKLQSIEAKLQGYIDTAKKQGQDVTSLQTALDDLKAKVTDATTQAQSASTQLLALTATSYPGNKSTMQTANTALKASRADLKTARADAETVIAGLRKMLTNVQ